MSHPASSDATGSGFPQAADGASKRADGPTLLGGSQGGLPPTHNSTPIDAWGGGSDERHWDLLGIMKDPFTFDIHEREAVLKAMQTCHSFNRDADVDLIDWARDQLYNAQMTGVSQERSYVYLIWRKLTPEMRQYSLDNGLGDPSLIHQPGFNVMHLLQRVRNICGIESSECWGTRQLAKLQQKNQESLTVYSHRWSNLATAAHGPWDHMSRLDKRTSFITMRNGLRSKAMSLEQSSNPLFDVALPVFHQWIREMAENLVLDTYKVVDNPHTITLTGNVHLNR